VRLVIADMSRKGPVRALKQCPYCGEEVVSRGLYLHVRNTEGGGHGEAGTVPKTFDPDEIEVTRYAPSGDNEGKFEGKAIRCKHCSQVFSDFTDAVLHLKQAEGSGDHPERFNPDTSLLAVPKQVTEAPKFHDTNLSPVGQYRKRFETGFQEPEKEEPTVPLSELEDLLDKFRLRETKSAAWVKAADELNDVLKNYRP
jgi:hypothetical protein